MKSGRSHSRRVWGPRRPGSARRGRSGARGRAGGAAWPWGFPRPAALTSTLSRALTATWRVALTMLPGRARRSGRVWLGTRSGCVRRGFKWNALWLTRLARPGMARGLHGFGGARCENPAKHNPGSPGQLHGNKPPGSKGRLRAGERGCSIRDLHGMMQPVCFQG